MKAKISDLAARIMIKSWYDDAMDDASEQYKDECVRSHFPGDVDDEFDMDLFLLKHEKDGWYVVH